MPAWRSLGTNWSSSCWEEAKRAGGRVPVPWVCHAGRELLHSPAVRCNKGDPDRAAQDLQHTRVLATALASVHVRLYLRLQAGQ